MSKFDPQLKDCISEMMEIAKKYDCGAFIMLGSKTHGEFDFQFPSWSVAQFEYLKDSAAKVLRIKAKGKPGDPIHENLEATVGFIFGMIETSEIHIQNMQKIINILKQKLEIERHPEWHFGNLGN